MIDKKKAVMENYFKTDCDINTSIKQAYERGFNRAYKKCMALMKKKTNKNCDTKNTPIRVMDLLWLFSDGYSGTNIDVEIDCKGDVRHFDAMSDLSEEIAVFDYCIVLDAYIEDNTLCLQVADR